MGSSCNRFIPTYMGNAHLLPVDRVLLPVHPHVHGERGGVGVCQNTGDGSSPRTWGTRTVNVTLRQNTRFIPTYMGNALDFPVTLVDSAVHPPVHGERKPALRKNGIQTGSSPRTWGTRGFREGSFVHHRFIPTYMGNAKEAMSGTHMVPVHPHVHGERSSLFIPERWKVTSTGPSRGSGDRHGEPAPSSASLRTVERTTFDTVLFVVSGNNTS